MAERVRQSGVTPPWRAVVFILASSAGVLVLRLAFAPLASRPGSIDGMSLRAYVVVWTLTGGLLIGHAWTLRAVEPRGWSYVRLGRESFSVRRILLGVIAGAAAIAVPSSLLLATGWLRPVPAPAGNSLGSALLATIALAPAAAWEELLVRGFFFALLREVWGTGRALLVTAALFGVMHLQNPAATVSSALLVGVAGLFLSWVLVVTESLYAAWAAHLSWNLVMVAAMHTAVSGISLATPDYRIVDSGPDWATGGAWGPEGGLFAVAGMAVTAGLLNVYRRRQRRGAQA